jgi:hypothetical protein
MIKIKHLFLNLLETNCTFWGDFGRNASDAKIDKEVHNRLTKANSTFGRLYKRVWNSKNVKKDTKNNVYKSIVLTILP